MKTKEMLASIKAKASTPQRQWTIPNIGPNGPRMLNGLPVADFMCEGKCCIDDICSLQTYINGYCIQPQVRSAVTGISLKNGYDEYFD